MLLDVFDYFLNHTIPFSDNLELFTGKECCAMVIREENLIKWKEWGLWSPTDLGWKFDFPTYWLYFIISSLQLSLPPFHPVAQYLVLSSLSSSLKSVGNGVEIHFWNSEQTRHLWISEGALFFGYSLSYLCLPCKTLCENSQHYR